MLKDYGKIFISINNTYFFIHLLVHQTFKVKYVLATGHLNVLPEGEIVIMYAGLG